MQDSHQSFKLHVVSQFLQYNEKKAQILRLLAIGFKFCKKSDITTIISMNGMRVDAHIGIACINF